MKKKIALYPGSFDPLTFGHIDIIKRAAKLFDKVVVCIFCNHKKTSLFTKKEKIEIMEEVLKNMPNVEVAYFDGLVVEFAKLIKANILIRGLRNNLDFTNEQKMALCNRELFDNIETLFFVADPKISFISSSFVRELFTFKKDVSKFVPKIVKNKLILKAKEIKENLDKIEEN